MRLIFSDVKISLQSKKNVYVIISDFLNPAAATVKDEAEEYPGDDITGKIEGKITDKRYFWFFESVLITVVSFPSA
jgi:hypothetical protein